MKMNKIFLALWRKEHMEAEMARIVLQPRLQAVIQAPVVRDSECFVLKPLWNKSLTHKAFGDRTEYEAFVNKIHIEDYLDNLRGTSRKRRSALVQQGCKAANELAARLRLEGMFRILVSLDLEMPVMTLRFFARRPSEGWGLGDPEMYGQEGIMLIDT
jgi:hypothetical protein